MIINKCIKKNKFQRKIQNLKITTRNKIKLKKKLWKIQIDNF